ncbi:transposase IS3/IS911 family protein, partial [mine drainage metagenome]
KKAIRREGAMAGNSTPSGKPVSGTKRTAAQKLATVVETASLNEAELGEYCRGTGLYPDEVHAWRAAAEAA